VRTRSARTGPTAQIENITLDLANKRRFRATTAHTETKAAAMLARKRTPTSPRRLPRSPLGTATVEAILSAVERILERDGVERLTTNHIAELAGVSIGSLYQYFPNKESLIGALQDRYAEDTLARVRAALDANADQPIRTVITRIGEAVLEAQRHQRPIHRALIDSRTAAGVWERYRGWMDHLVDLIAEFLATRDDIEVADVRTAAFVVVHAAEGLIEAASERADVNMMQIALDGVEMVARFVERRPR
jgi:AcrR family transcriptional regulator